MSTNRTATDQFKNPTDTKWLDGPLDRAFAMPKPDGTVFPFKARDMLDTTAPTLDYVYDDDNNQPVPVNHLAVRFERLGLSPSRATEMAGAVTMAPPKPAELVGANSSVVRLSNDGVETKIPLDNTVRRKLTATMDTHTFSMTAPHAPDRVYLNLENIKSPSDAAAFDVYVNLPKDADPKKHPELFAGTVSMFGARKASASDGPRGGNGLSASLNITHIVDKMHQDKTLSGDISVKLVSSVPGASSDKISIGRISIYRQGQ